MKIRLMLATLATATILSSAAFAQTMQPAPAPAQPDPGHPRINEVQDRLNTQEDNTMKAEESGKITAAQANRDEKRDQNIQGRLDKDESAHHGHITKREQRRLNHSENSVRNQKAWQKDKDKHTTGVAPAAPTAR